MSEEQPSLRQRMTWRFSYAKDQISRRMPWHSELRELQAERRRLESIVVQPRAEDESVEEHEVFQRQLSTALRHTYNSIARLQTQQLVEKAEHLSVPLPSGDDNWIGTTGLLTDEGFQKLRTAIRQEQKDRSEIVRLWLAGVGPIMAAITGIIGAVTGLIALLLK